MPIVRYVRYDTGTITVRMFEIFSSIFFREKKRYSEESISEYSTVRYGRISWINTIRPGTFLPTLYRYTIGYPKKKQCHLSLSVCVHIMWNNPCFFIEKLIPKYSSLFLGAFLTLFVHFCIAFIFLIFKAVHKTN